MAITELCGFECRLLGAGSATTPDEDHWDGAGGTPTISTTTIRSGTAALRSNPTAGTAQLNKSIVRRVVAGRIYLRVASLPLIAENTTILIATNVSGNLRVRLDGLGQLTVQVVGGTAQNVGSPLTADGLWHRIDWLFDSSTGTASAKATLDGGTEATSTNVQVAADMTVMRIGVFDTSTCDLFLDDLVMGDATTDYPFGEGSVERMKPTRDGTHSFTAGDFAYDTAGANVATNATDVWTKVDEDDLTSTADLIRQIVIRSTGYVEVGFGTPPQAWDAQAVNVVSTWHSAGTGANTMGMKLNDGGTLKNITDEAGDGLTDISQITLCSAEKVLTTAPSGGVWTDTKLAAVLIRAGYSTDVNAIPYWDGVMLEVAYGPARLRPSKMDQQVRAVIAQ